MPEQYLATILADAKRALRSLKGTLGLDKRRIASAGSDSELTRLTQMPSQTNAGPEGEGGKLDCESDDRCSYKEPRDPIANDRQSAVRYRTPGCGRWTCGIRHKAKLGVRIRQYKVGPGSIAPRSTGMIAEIRALGVACGAQICPCPETRSGQNVGKRKKGQTGTQESAGQAWVLVRPEGFEPPAY